MPLLPNINIGSAPNDGTGANLRSAFQTVNENFQFIETFFPNTDVANLTANITSTGTSTFNDIQVATIGNAGSVFTGATISAATVGNSGSILTGTLSTASQTNITSVGTLSTLAVSGLHTGTTINAAVVNSATVGNSGTLITGTLTDNAQPNITSIGSLTSLIVVGQTDSGSVNTNSIISGNLLTISANNIHYSNTSLENILGTVYQTQYITGNVVGPNIDLDLGLSGFRFESYDIDSNVTFNFINSVNGKEKSIFIWNANTTTAYYVNLPSDINNKFSNSILINPQITARFDVVSFSEINELAYVTVANN